MFILFGRALRGECNVGNFLSGFMDPIAAPGRSFGSGDELPPAPGEARLRAPQLLLSFEPAPFVIFPAAHFSSVQRMLCIVY